MNSRERMLAAFEYSNPDKIPVLYKPCAAGLYVHGQKFVDLMHELPPDNPLSIDGLPEPSPECVDADGLYRERKYDEWGTLWEYTIFGIAGHPAGYPFGSWAAAGEYNFPPVPEPGQLAYAGQKADKKNYLIFCGWHSLFEKLHALRPIEELFMALIDEDADLLNLMDRLTDYHARLIDVEIKAGADVIMFGDDWGHQHGPAISPEMFKALFRPRYEKLFRQVKRAGCKVFLHSCGRLGPILNEFLDMGIDGIWPQILCYDLEELSGKLKKSSAAMFIHPDRQYLVPNGTPKQIQEAVQQYCEYFHRLGGGGIFHIEMENDAPWENVECLIRSIHKYR